MCRICHVASPIRALHSNPKLLHSCVAVLVVVFWVFAANSYIGRTWVSQQALRHHQHIAVVQAAPCFYVQSSPCSSIWLTHCAGGVLLVLCSVLQEEAEACGLAGCGNLWLSVQGVAYVSQVIATVQPAKANECPIQAKRRGTPGKKAGDFWLQEQQDALLGQQDVKDAHQQRQGAAQGEFFAGNVFILSAPMTVASPTHEPRWDHGSTGQTV
jgi:hypothetical protein